MCALSEYCLHFIILFPSVFFYVYFHFVSEPSPFFSLCSFLYFLHIPSFGQPRKKSGHLSLYLISCVCPVHQFFSIFYSLQPVSAEGSHIMPISSPSSACPDRLYFFLYSFLFMKFPYLLVSPVTFILWHFFLIFPVASFPHFLAIPIATNHHFFPFYFFGLSKVRFVFILSCFLYSFSFPQLSFVVDPERHQSMRLSILSFLASAKWLMTYSSFEFLRCYVCQRDHGPPLSFVPPALSASR